MTIGLPRRERQPQGLGYPLPTDAPPESEGRRSNSQVQETKRADRKYCFAEAMLPSASFREALDREPNIVLLLDREGTIIHVNRAWTEVAIQEDVLDAFLSKRCWGGGTSTSSWET
jgi:PAS domain-containing protein